MKILVLAIILLAAPVAASEKPDNLLDLFLRREAINDKLNTMQAEANKLQAERVKIQAEIDKKMKEKK